MEQVQIDRGARFRRADLHIHTAASHDVGADPASPESIIDSAIQNGVEVIAITDHNKIDNVQAALSYAEGKNILVVPGVELTVAEGHLLVYAPSFDALQRILGALDFSDDYKACRTGASQILQTVERHQGLAVFAHIERDQGVENRVPGYGDPKAVLFSATALAGLEIAESETQTWFTQYDVDDARREFYNKHLKGLGGDFSNGIPKVHFSDAHNLSEFTDNIKQDRRLTRLKMSSLSWDALRAAFADPEARVRLEIDVPKHVPQFVSMKMQGGFTAGENFIFSSNLTCIIGGRGSGKSTSMAVLRKFAGRPIKLDLTRSDAWPDQAELVYVDEQGRKLNFILRSDGDIECYDTNGEPVYDYEIQIDALDQGDVAKTAEESGSNQTSLMMFLDGLLNIEDKKNAAEEIRSDLIENGTTIQELQVVVAGFDTVEQQLQGKLKQETAAKASNSDELVLLQGELVKADVIRRELISTFKQTAEDMSESLGQEVLGDMVALAENADGLNGAADLENPIRAFIDTCQTVLSEAQSDISEALKESEPSLRQYITALETKHNELRVQISAEVEKLEKAGVKLDMKYLTDLAQSVQRLRSQHNKLLRQKKELAEAEKKRKQLLKDYHGALESVYQERNGLAIRLTQALQDFMVDYQVSVKYEEACIANELESIIVEVCDFRTNSVPVIANVIEVVGAIQLIKAIESKDNQFLRSIKDTQGNVMLTDQQIQRLIQSFTDFANLRRIQECHYDDLPRLVLTRKLKKGEGDGAVKVMKKEFSQLSMGQRQSIILAILLTVETNRPLLIDQPEDNLDSAFVYQVLVRALRRVKEVRQVILVTHNANICVLGDSDQVIPLKATADKGVIIATGTVDNELIRGHVCEILEGGKSAYQYRGEIYGI